MGLCFLLYGLLVLFSLDVRDMHFKLNFFTMMACLDMHIGGLHVGNSCIVVYLDTGMLAWLGCIGTDICIVCDLLCGQSIT